MAWQRLPGASRNYVNTETGEILSRRQYDKRFGALAKEGVKSYEQKAAKNKAVNELAQLARPARGRKSIADLAPEVQEEVTKARQEFKRQKETTTKVQKEINKAKNRARRVPKISDRLLTSGKMGRRITCPLDQESIEQIIVDARSTHAKFYGVGVNGIDDRTGDFRSVWFQTNRLKVMRDISVDFTESDFEDMEEMIAEYGYLIPVSAFVYLAFESEYVKKRKETNIRKKRKQVFGKSL